MIKEISRRLNVQFVIITHELALAAHADRVFETKIRKRVTQIK